MVMRHDIERRVGRRIAANKQQVSNGQSLAELNPLPILRDLSRINTSNVFPRHTSNEVAENLVYCLNELYYKRPRRNDEAFS